MTSRFGLRRRWLGDRAPATRVTAAFRQWFANRSLREQRLFALLGVMAIVVLVVAGAVRPFQREHARLMAEIHGYQTLDQELRAAGPLLGDRPHRAAGDLTAAVQGAAEKAGLTVERIEPEGGGLRLTLADTPFPAVLDFLSQLESDDGVSAAQARIDAAPDPGHVDAQLLLRR